MTEIKTHNTITIREMLATLFFYTLFFNWERGSFLYSLQHSLYDGLKFMWVPLFWEWDHYFRGTHMNCNQSLSECRRECVKESVGSTSHNDKCYLFVLDSDFWSETMCSSLREFSFKYKLSASCEADSQPNKSAKLPFIHWSYLHLIILINKYIMVTIKYNPRTFAFAIKTLNLVKIWTSTWNTKIDNNFGG